MIKTGALGTGRVRVEFNEGTGAMGNENGFVDGNAKGVFAAAVAAGWTLIAARAA